MPEENQTSTPGTEQQSDNSQGTQSSSRDAHAGEGRGEKQGQDAPSSESGYSNSGSAAGTAKAPDSSDTGNTATGMGTGQSGASNSTNSGTSGAPEGQSNEPGLASDSAWRPGDEPVGAKQDRDPDASDNDIISERGDSGGGSSF